MSLERRQNHNRYSGTREGCKVTRSRSKKAPLDPAIAEARRKFDEARQREWDERHRQWDAETATRESQRSDYQGIGPSLEYLLRQQDEERRRRDDGEKDRWREEGERQATRKVYEANPMVIKFREAAKQYAIRKGDWRHYRTDEDEAQWVAFFASQPIGGPSVLDALQLAFLRWEVASKYGSGPEPFQILGLASNASIEDVKQAYRKLSLEHHPDKGGDQVMFIRINEAYKSAIRLARARLTG